MNTPPFSQTFLLYGSRRRASAILRSCSKLQLSVQRFESTSTLLARLQHSPESLLLVIADGSERALLAQLRSFPPLLVSVLLGASAPLAQQFIEAGGWDCTATTSPAELSVALARCAARQAQAKQQRMLSEAHSLFHAADNHMLLLDADGRILDINRRCLESMGAERDEVLGVKLWLTPWFDDDSRELRERFAHAIESAARGLSVRFEGAVDEPNDRRAHFRLSFKPFHSRWQPCAAVLVEASELSRVFEAEQRAAACEARMHSLFDSNTMVAVQWFDADGRIHFWNAASEKMYGFRPQDALGRRMEQLGQSPRYCAELLAQLRTKQRPSSTFESFFRRRDGSFAACLSSVFPLPSNGAQQLYARMEVDITEFKLAEASLLEQIEFDALLNSILSLYKLSGTRLLVEIPARLQAVARHFQTECAYLLQSDDAKHWNIAYSWQEPSRQSASLSCHTTEPCYRLIPAEDAAPWMQRVRSTGKALRVDAQSNAARLLSQDPPVRILEVAVDERPHLTRLGIASRHLERSWSDENLRRLQMLADAFANVLQQQRSTSAIQAKSNELALLNRVILAASSERAPTTVLGLACRELSQALHVQEVSVLLMDSDQSTARVVAHHCPGSWPSLVHTTIARSELTFLAQLEASRRPLSIELGENSVLSLHALFVSRRLNALLAVPLFIDDEFFGALLLASTTIPDYAEPELSLVVAIASQLASVLDRVRGNELRQRLLAAIEQTPETILITDTDAKIVYVNRTCEEVTGYARSECLGQTPRLFNSGKHDPSFFRQMWLTLLSGQRWQGRIVNRRKSGELYTEHAIIAPVRNDSGSIINFIGVKRDISHELRMEEQFQQAQRMEAVGQLAGGVAHDFNNVLTAFVMQLHAMQHDPRLPKALVSGFEELQQVANRAGSLTRQLLLFSRREAMRTQHIDVIELLGAFVDMIRRVIGENIQLLLSLAKEPLWIDADSGMIEQVLMNLCINARDAMPHGGTLQISAHRISPEQAAELKRPQLCADSVENGMRSSKRQQFPQPQVCIEVQDTGCGMSPEILSRVFEPFFTTKEVGKGTGLGLASAHGIILQHRGHIEVESTPNEGTRFRILLPLCTEGLSEHGSPPPALTKKPMRILVVEDDEPVRRVAVRLLTAWGHEVQEACEGTAAYTLACEQAQPFELLFTDLVLPDSFDGVDLACALREHTPQLQVIVTSGYPQAIQERARQRLPDILMLPKPYTPAQLQQCLELTLQHKDSSPPTSASRIPPKPDTIPTISNT